MNLSLHDTSHCRHCELADHVGTHGHVGIGTRVIGPHRPIALVCVGQNPGWNESVQGEPWIGRSGRYLRDVYLQGTTPSIESLCTVYLTNAVRCRTVRDRTPTEKYRRTCLPHFLKDLRKIVDHHEETILFVLGGVAAGALFHSSLEDLMKRQGIPRSLNWKPLVSYLPSRRKPGAILTPLHHHYRKGLATLASLPELPTFSTYHPAFLMKRRSPAHWSAVCDHLELLRDHLTGSFKPTSATVISTPSPISGPPPSSTLCLDCETYGYYHRTADGFKLPIQHHFHPEKCVHHDGVDRQRLVQLVSISWRTREGISSVYVDFSRPSHRKLLREWLAEARTLEGMNLPFDLKMLRACDRSFESVLDPYRLTLIDLSVVSYLHSELRPERSLKSISQLLQTHIYEHIPKKNERFESPLHPDSLRYCQSDTVATISTLDRLFQLIPRDFPDTDKLSDSCIRYYSDLLWTLVLAGEDGIHFSPSILRDLQFRNALRCELLRARLEYRYDFPISGKGSRKAIESAVVSAVKLLDCADHPDLQKTTVTEAISANASNFTLLTQLLRDYHGIHPRISSTSSRVLPPGQRNPDEPPHSPGDGRLPIPELGGRPSLPDQDGGDDHAGRLLEIFETVEAFRAHNGIISNYTYPLLFHRRNKKDHSSQRASRLIHGIAYPDWFAVPTSVKDDSGSSGGTQQSRVIAKNPAVLTIPASDPSIPFGHLYDVKSSITSRYSGGTIIWVDLSQIELRILALLSGDPRMIREYELGIDRHVETALLILDIIDPRQTLHPWESWTTEWKDPSHPASSFRQAGKTSNFLIAFRGDAFKWAITMRNDIKMVVNPEDARNFIDEIRSRYKGVDQWQLSLIESAIENRFLSLPITGESRYFLGSRQQILDTYVPTICNFPIQATAAKVNLVAWSTLQRILLSRNLNHAVSVPLNTYDSLTIDCHPRAVDEVLSLLPYIYSPDGNWYLGSLFAHLGRSIPITHDIKRTPHLVEDPSCSPLNSSKLTTPSSNGSKAPNVKSPSADTPEPARLISSPTS